MELARWRTFQGDEIAKVVVIIEKMEVLKDREYAKLTVVSSATGICYTAICRDKELYGRVVEGDVYALCGVIERDDNGLRLVVDEIYGADGWLLTVEESEYFFNLNPIEIGSLV
jgi:hypothetical protein